MIPSVSQYAGQQLVTGQQAQSYADNFIAVLGCNRVFGRHRIIGVIDGSPPVGIEQDTDVADRRSLLRAIGYKL
jgi:adenosine/AMP kinase